ncbi:50S ribosome-binding GTPase [Gracilaria domingensis]|nr:50S ribosome-binding GTPase [Gracilaria domingensis]
MAPHVKSKRQTLKHKYKVEKKVRQHRREVRRANKHKPEVRKIRKKDPGIPNLWPFKKQMMEAIERKKAQEAEAKRAMLEARREANKEMDAAGMDPALLDVAADANRRAAEFESRQHEEDGEPEASSGLTQDGSRRAFMKEFKKVLESSDVILEVLDARDPIGCRCYEAEKAVLTASGGAKRIVLVLNKVDMVPKEIADKWLSYLRNEFPTVPFRASVEQSRSKGQANMTALAASSVNTSECLGAANLLSLLKNYSRTRNLKTSVTVGVIGYPNVGKSSLINSLKRCRAVSAGATPGLTRNAQEVHLDKNIRLIDCPGIVFSANQADALVLRNCIKIEQLHDPISPVETIIKRVGGEPLMVAYSVPQFDNVTEFLAYLCSSRGKFRRGGSYDVEAAARIVLQDWNSGKIPFYTLPPKGPSTAHLSASIVQQWSQEFDINGVKEGEAARLESMAQAPTVQFASASASTPQMNTEGNMTDETPENEKKDSGNANTEPTFHVAPKAAKGILKKKSRVNQDKMELQ